MKFIMNMIVKKYFSKPYNLLNRQMNMWFFICLSLLILNSFTFAQDKILTLVEVEKGKTASSIVGLDRASSVAISKDGFHVYVAGNDNDAIAHFTKSVNNGVLKFKSAYLNGEKGIIGLDGPNTLVISPDGNHLYSSLYVYNGIAAFSRNLSTGELSFIESVTNGEKGVFGLDRVVGISISPDGHHVCLCSQAGNALAVFGRNKSNGMLEFIELIEDNTGEIDGLAGASNVIISQNGKHVYVTSQGDDAIAVFGRDSNSGKLTFIEVYKNRLNNIQGLDNVFNLIESPDGNHIFTTGAGDNAVVVFRRDKNSGKLTFVEHYQNGINGIEGIDNPLGITCDPDGKYLYIAGAGSDALAVFRIEKNTGLLSFVEFHTKALNPKLALDEPRGMAVSSDGNYLYATGRIDDALNVFNVNRQTGSLTFLNSYKNFIGLGEPRCVTVSPDNKFVYVTSRRGDAISVFQRKRTNGELMLIETYRNEINGIEGLDGAIGAKISPDGGFLYVNGYVDHTVVAFKIDKTSGKLTLVEIVKNGKNGVKGLNTPFWTEISPDGKHLYISGFNDNSLVVFGRDKTSGKLKFIETLVSNVAGVSGLTKSTGLKLSPDGKFLYVDSQGEDAIALFSRDETTGKLTFVEVQKDNVNNVSGLDGGSSDVVISDDGNNLYAVGFNNGTIAVFNRNKNSGKISFVELIENGVNNVEGLNGAYHISISSDGLMVYVTGRNDNALTIFKRDVNTGRLTFSEVYYNGMNGISGLNGADDISISPDGLSVYVTGRIDNTIAVFKKN